jgi:hypothetical protein
MPPVMSPEMPALDTAMTMAPILPSMGSMELRRLLPPSLGTSSGGACRGILPEGTRGGARRVADIVTSLHPGSG